MSSYTFRRRNSVIFIVASNVNWGHLIKERICSHWSKFFALRVDPILGRLSGKQTGSHENCLPLKTWRKKMAVYPFTLSPSYWAATVGDKLRTAYRISFHESQGLAHVAKSNIRTKNSSPVF